MAWQSNPKPEPWKRVKARRRAAERAARDRCRGVVFRRDGGRCQQCHRPLVLTMKEAQHEFDVAHIHESPPRSLGGDPTNPDHCTTLCCQCHAAAHH